MICKTLRWICPVLITAGIASSLPAQSLDTPMTRLRPIGAPSAVDQYRPRPGQSTFRETSYDQRQISGPVVQAIERYDGSPRPTVQLQQFDAPQLPGSMQLPGGFTPPATGMPAPSTPPIGTNNFAAPPATVTPSPSTPRGLPTSPGGLAPVPISPSPTSTSGDFAQIAPPQLNDGFATIDNCNCISPPSSYVAGSAMGGCAPVSYQAPQVAAQGPAPIAGPSILPGGIAPRPGGIPAGPLFTLGQQAYPVQVGQGWYGQPVAYVPGQPFRNWIRYLFP